MPSLSERTECLTAEDIIVGQTLQGNTATYSVEKFIGQGSFGKVAQCQNVKTKEMVAVKMLKDPAAIKEADDEVAMLEILSSIDCNKSNVVQFLERFEYKGLTCLAFEMLDMSLLDLFKSKDWEPLSPCEIRPIAQQLLVALEALKGLGVLHTDLKADNIMLSNMEQQPFRVKLIDFGLALFTSEVEPGMWKQPCGYRAPEVALGNMFSEAIDMWGLGCNLAFLYLGRHLFPINCDYQMMRRMVEIVGCPPEYLLLNGAYTKYFFTEEEEDDNDNWSINWRLLTPEEFTKVSKTSPKEYNGYVHEPQSLDDLVDVFPKWEPEEYEDRKAFVDLLKGLLHPDPALRLSPQQALQHPFITMAHLSQDPKGIDYLMMSKQVMRVCVADGSTDVAALEERSAARNNAVKSEKDIQHAGLLLNAFNSAALSPKSAVSSDECGQSRASQRDDQFKGLIPESDSAAADRAFEKDFELRGWRHKKTLSAESGPSDGANSDSDVWSFKKNKTKRPKKSEFSESLSNYDKPVAASRSLDRVTDDESDLWSHKMIQKRGSEKVNRSKFDIVSDSSSLDGVKEVFRSVWNLKRPKKAASEKGTSQNIVTKTKRSEHYEPSDSLSLEAKPVAVPDARSLDRKKDSDSEVWVLKITTSQRSEKKAQPEGQIRDAKVNVLPRSPDTTKASPLRTVSKERPKTTPSEDILYRGKIPDIILPVSLNKDTAPDSRVWAQERKKLDGDATRASSFHGELSLYKVLLIQVIVQVFKIGLNAVVVKI